MDLLQVMSKYTSRMVESTIENEEKPKMRVLLLDEGTAAYLTAETSFSRLMAQRIYYLDRLENDSREQVQHLECICFVKPTSTNIQLLLRELENPKYGSYDLFFSSAVDKSYLKQLAEADDLELVRSVKELFTDYIVVNSDFFTLSTSNNPLRVWGNQPNVWNRESLERHTSGLFSVLASLKKNPIIRYSRSSALASDLAREVDQKIRSEAVLFNAPQPDTPPVLLILDRREDPLTPLLTQWTYQAMVHELLGIENGKVTFQNKSGSDQKEKEAVLSQGQDPFFKSNMYLNFGDLGENVRTYVEQFSSKSNRTKGLETIEEMKKFVEEYPEFRKLSSNVTKHVDLIDELSRQVREGRLMEVSGLEQAIACNNTHDTDVKTLQKIITDEGILPDNKIRLVAIYALRYLGKEDSSVGFLIDLMRTAGASESEMDLVLYVLAFYMSIGSTMDKQDAKEASVLSNFLKGKGLIAGEHDRFRQIKGVDNIYTQHTAPLYGILEGLVQGKLSRERYPPLRGDTNARVQDVIVFFVGGATFEEAHMVASLNGSVPLSQDKQQPGPGSEPFRSAELEEAFPGVRIVLGGSTVHSSRSFLEETRATVLDWPAAYLNDVRQKLRGRR